MDKYLSELYYISIATETNENCLKQKRLWIVLY